MEFKQLQAFVAVVQERSFTKAAQRLYCSQPSISSHLRQLETELQSKLLLRSTKSLEITAAGWEFYEYAVHTLELRAKLLKRWAETQNVIHLGASTIPSAYILPEILPAYRQAYPQHSFLIKQSDSSTVIKGLLSRIYDIGLIGKPYEDEALTTIPFYRDRLILITPAQERYQELQNQATLPLELLFQEPIILREQGSASQEVAASFLQSIGIAQDSLNVTARLNDQEAIKNLVAGGLGVALISAKAAQNFLTAGRLLSFELPGELVQRYLYLIWRHEVPQPSLLRQFAQFVQDYYRLQFSS